MTLPYDSSREADYLVGLPEAVINKAGCGWSIEERDALMISLRAPENDRRVMAYIGHRVKEADEEDLKSALSHCQFRALHDGEFLAKVRLEQPRESYAESGQAFVSWFRANYPAASALVPRKVGQHFQSAHLRVKEGEEEQPFDGQTPLAAWLESVLQRGGRRRGTDGDRLIRIAASLEKGTPFDPRAEPFCTWFLRIAAESIWREIEQFEREHRFDESETRLDAWLVEALGSRALPRLLLRGYKSFSPEEGDFAQWYFGVVVRRVIDDLRREKLRGGRLLSWEEYLEHGGPEGAIKEPEPVPEEELLPGWSGELFETVLGFVEGVEPPVIGSRLARAFPRYARALRLRGLHHATFAEMAAEFGTEGYARKLVSRGLEAFFGTMGVATDVAGTVAQALACGPRCASVKALRLLQAVGPVLLAVYGPDDGKPDPLSERWIAQLAARLGLTTGAVRAKVRAAWEILWPILDADGKSIYDFAKVPVRVTKKAARIP